MVDLQQDNRFLSDTAPRSTDRRVRQQRMPWADALTVIAGVLLCIMGVLQLGLQSPDFASGLLPFDLPDVPFRSTTSLLVVGGLWAIAAAITGIVRPKARVTTTPLIFVAGIIGLIYFTAAYIGVSSWFGARLGSDSSLQLGLILVIFLLLQIFIPRDFWVLEEGEWIHHRRGYVSAYAAYRFPWWLLFLIITGFLIALSIASNTIYYNIFEDLSAGVVVTLYVTAISYVSALSLGLLLGLIRSEPPQPGKGVLGSFFSFVRLILYNIATVYVEIMRGLPILIVLLIMAFVVVPAVRDDLLEPLLGIEIDVRGTSPTTAIIALALAYAAFMSETFRAGIQSIEKGQLEAARSLGMRYPQVMRHIVLPQAIRRVLPPLGNDFIALIKDSSLVSVLAVNDITNIARTSSGRSFRYLETYLTVALLYLLLTLIGSQLVKWMERSLKQQEPSSSASFRDLWLRFSRWGRQLP